jgi:hypothetical protein
MTLEALRILSEEVVVPEVGISIKKVRAGHIWYSPSWKGFIRLIGVRPFGPSTNVP